MGRHTMMVKSEERQSKLELGIDRHSVEPIKSHNPTHSQRLLEVFGGHGSHLFCPLHQSLESRMPLILW